MSDNNIKEKIDSFSSFLNDKKVEDIVVLNVGERGAFCDYFIIGSVNSERQAKALYKECIGYVHRLKWPVIGMDSGESFKWLVMDFGDIVVHIFQAETRKYYDLENLWCAAEAKRKEFIKDDTENIQ